MNRFTDDLIGKELVISSRNHCGQCGDYVINISTIVINNSKSVYIGQILNHT